VEEDTGKKIECNKKKRKREIPIHIIITIDFYSATWAASRRTLYDLVVASSHTNRGA